MSNSLCFAPVVVLSYIVYKNLSCLTVFQVGDPKDAVRNSVKAIFKLIGSIYPVSKLFTYIMDGLKSKNARQRTGKLMVLESCMINSFEMNKNGLSLSRY